MPGLTILSLQPSPEGYWEASVVVGDSDPVTVNKRNGSWQTLPDVNGHFQDVSYDVAAVLQAECAKLNKKGVGFAGDKSGDRDLHGSS